MKKLLFLFLFFFIFNNVKAQPYSVGVPVYDTIQTIITYPMYIHNCPYGKAAITNSLIEHMPTGVNLYFKVLSSQLSTGCLNITNVGIMNVGDSSLITTANNQFEWSALCDTGNMTFAILAIGTPTNLGDSFYCNSQWAQAYGLFVDGCATYMEIDFYRTSIQPDCIVDSNITTDISNFYEKGISIYPNPFSVSTTIETELQIRNAAFEMYNIYGKKVKQLQLTNSKTEISRDNLPAGVYFYKIKSERKTVEQGKILIQ